MGLHLAKQKTQYGIQPNNKAYSDDHLVRKRRSLLNSVYPLRFIHFRRRPKSAISSLKDQSDEKKTRRPEGFRDVPAGYGSLQVRSSRSHRVSPAAVNSTKIPAAGAAGSHGRCTSLHSVVNDLRMRTYTKLTSAESTCTLDTEHGLVSGKVSEDGDLDATIDLANGGNGSNDILQRTVEFLAYEIEPYVIEEYFNSKRLSDRSVQVEASSVSSSVESMREFLSPIIRDPDSEDYRSFCDVLREQVHEHYLADFLEVLGALLKLKAEDDEAGNRSCICRLTGGLCPHSDRSFELELVYVDRETRKRKSFNGVTSLKRRRYRKSRAEADHVTRVRVGDTADRYVPMLSVRMYAQCLCEVRIRRLQRLMDTYPCIRDLSLVKTRLEDQAKVRLARAIEQNVGLYQLDLNLSTLGDDGAMFLASALRSNRHLRSLNLSSNELTSTACRLLVKGITCSRTLTELNLGFNDVGDRGSIALAEVLGNKCQLRKLKLRSNNITASGAIAIFTSLCKNSRLRLLDLSSNDVTDDALRALSDALIRNRTLTDLSIDNCGISKSGCQTLARPLKINTMLKSLSLSLNAIGDTGIRKLSEGIKHNRSLTEISLNMCEISNPGLWDLLDAIRYNSKMKTVKLCYNLIDIGCNFKHDIRAFRNGEAASSTNNAISKVEKGRMKRHNNGVTSGISSLVERKSCPLVNRDAIFGLDSAFFDNDGDTSVDDVSSSELYLKLVEVLHWNSPLKVVLWGNRLDDVGHHLSVTSSQDSIDFY